jgi:KaiC/GvpD/RAD55 family RecA-like ATPase
VTGSKGTNQYSAASLGKLWFQKLKYEKAPQNNHVPIAMKDLPPPTGIPELNCLLGLKNDVFPLDHTTILIRGGQGAGKTTLALQILSNQLAVKNNFGLFLSLERPAKDAVTYVHDNFKMFKLDDGGDANKVRAAMIDGRAFSHVLKSEYESGRKILDSLKSFIPLAKIKIYDFVEIDVGGIAENLVSKRLESKEATHKEAFHYDLASTVCRFVDTDTLKNGGTLWLVIDSLNILERAIFQRTDLKKYRAALQGLAMALFDRLNKDRTENEKVKIVILFTGEYHTPNKDVSGASGESFFCDVEILLSQEPIVGTARTDPRNSAAAGYNIELHHNPHGIGSPKNDNTPNKDNREVVETRAFCRVLKSRFSRNQSRRCFYKIEPEKGFVFDETFPGDGYLLLFEDNLNQRKDWEETLLLDAPHEFPALRYELFDRTSQQRVFSTERRFRNHAHATDLKIVSLDTYWINWFIELEQRLTIKNCLQDRKISVDTIWNALKKSVPPSATDDDVTIKAEAGKQFSHIVCCMHKCFLKDGEGKPEPDFESIAGQIKNDYKCIDSERSEIKIAIEYCWKKFKDCNGMLQPIELEHLRLFGEQRSELLQELASLRYISKEVKKQNVLLSIPFNANASYLVYREDLLIGLKETKKSMKAELEQKISASISELLENEYNEIKTFLAQYWDEVNKVWPNPSIPAATPDFNALWAKVGNDLCGLRVGNQTCKTCSKCANLAKSLANGRPPKTWEEIIILCQLKKWNFIIETLSFDTLLCTFLEFVWGCGAELAVDAEYTLTMNPTLLARLYQAIYLFQKLLINEEGHMGDKRGHQIIPPNSTVNPQTFGKNYSKPKDKKDQGSAKPNNWAFMRQWHSTLVDILVAKKTGPDGVPQEFCWNPPQDTKLEIAPLPRSQWQILRRLTGEDLNNTELLIEKLKKDKDEKTELVSTFIRGQLIQAFKNKLEPANDLSKLTEEDLVHGLNQVLADQSHPLYDEARFKKTNLSDATRALFKSKQKPEGEYLVVLNRWLMEETYPAFFKSGISCWGDWHLAVLQGSENTKLAEGVLNNLMNSAKISNRALRGAALPTVAEFYKIYEKTPCVLLPERSGSHQPNDIELPKKTYGALRNEIFSCAKSRSTIFDYRHCMLEFHGFIKQLLHKPEMKREEIGEELLKVFKRIRKLRDRELLLH